MRSGVHPSSQRSENGVGAGGQGGEATHMLARAHHISMGKGTQQETLVLFLSLAKKVPFPEITTVLDTRIIILNDKSDNIISNLRYSSGSPLLLG